jgi:RNA polymerase sigma factor (sigma-70 family)
MIARLENRGAAAAMAPASTTHGTWFTTTHWSVVMEAAQSTGVGGIEALDELCRAYWYPLYAYVRRQGASPHDAQDLVQGFFARLLEKNYLQAVDPLKGRFRSFLLAALKHFLLDDAKRERAEKRGGGCAVLSLDGQVAQVRYDREADTNLTPEQVFDRNWALAIMDQALVRLRGELRAGVKGAEPERLLAFLSSAPAEQDYSKLSAELGISRGAVAARVHRLRQRYRELVRDYPRMAPCSPPGSQTPSPSGCGGWAEAPLPFFSHFTSRPGAFPH